LILGQSTFRDSRYVRTFEAGFEAGTCTYQNVPMYVHIPRSVITKPVWYVHVPYNRPSLCGTCTYLITDQIWSITVQIWSRTDLIEGLSNLIEGLSNLIEGLSNLIEGWLNRLG
jgi:hypothetical protein